jgi:hypothetical protein
MPRYDRCKNDRDIMNIIKKPFTQTSMRMRTAVKVCVSLNGRYLK